MQKIWIALAKDGKLWKLNEIIQRNPKTIELFPHIPFGYHATVHDADPTQGHQHGVIHFKLCPTQGVVRSFPGGEQTSDHRGVILPERQIPAFKDINEPISVYSDDPRRLPLTNADVISDQLQELETRDKKDASLAIVNMQGNALGYAVLLVPTDKPHTIWDLLTKIQQQRSLWSIGPVMSSVYLFRAFVPWLAVITSAEEMSP